MKLVEGRQFSRSSTGMLHQTRKKWHIVRMGASALLPVGGRSCFVFRFPPPPAGRHRGVEKGCRLPARVL